ncbi:PREDICTED: syntaxin-61-like [Ipomoea nil]|uniref:syntaxin-61-like n=1 Tax=Ipomoea nil TaxID=35883 RepID=UPI0009016C04|nr:PREDICTED: syntaxin-61-like [Ipomoea nil]XP_019152999.1 PREDICTED: syntaxin-61-like [Ipomoea nil]XP_019153000.1 PREDICTED: syntaxin-61-like [Ipomoea nil]
MATQYDRWEKDPFFSAAEEIQESADRMETIYRTWVHAVKDKSNIWNCEELRRDLKTALGTTQWQLEEFDRAVKSSYTSSSADDAEHRHQEFVFAIDCQIKKVAGSLTESDVSQGKPPSPWVRLDKGERDELALFLTGPTGLAADNDKELMEMEKLGEEGKQSMFDGLRSSSSYADKCLAEINEDKLGHRRTASASADIGAWKIAVSDDLSSMQPQAPPRKNPSFSGFKDSKESAAKLKFAKNGYRKFKNSDCHYEGDASLPQTQQSARGSNTGYERNKSCLNGCDRCYDKQLYGWHGVIQRQFQRSQYYMLYSRPVRVVFVIILLCLIGFMAMRM